MDAVLHIPAGERDLIRVFALDMPPEQARFLREPGALAQVLGIEEINLDQVEIFPITDLEELGLVGYLTEGCGLPAEQLTDDHERLTGLSGHVMLIRSRAFGGEETRLTPASQISLIGAYGEDQNQWAGTSLHSDSAKPYSASHLSPRASRSKARRIGASLFAVVMLLLLILLSTLVGWP
ncbi:hypothetical protein [Parasedimentitalea psychrophila]|uniref:Aspartate carbamoyltransferase catalytic subunit n=1 Tax=Parasedimentitalea psychrophila TaxID=2997337 RepID=A0A9Y2L2D3_9RHOB|nr:hypothetical protein [Parasedimentitalea psychrophila]WIY26292.1 hypothetical protein QPJ95_05040 [Parasedimentitalea psychrophila]